MCEISYLIHFRVHGIIIKITRNESDSMFLDTIAAIATPLQEGAISIIRVSGDDAIDIVNKIFSRDLTKISSHQVMYGYIKENDSYIDEVLVSVFKAPKSFTMEDIVEINCHGGIYITKKILSLVLASGARLADKGEFTKRAFLNGRIDLTQAEAINDLISGKDQGVTKVAMQALRGGVRKLIEPLKEDLIQIIGQIEVNIDYPEYYDVETVTEEILLPKTKEWLQNINNLLNKSQSGKIMREGIKCVILGKPNVGKSSLLNALLEEDKAIVTDIEGTTRDLVEGYVRLPSITLHLIDTAGIRETEDVVEKIGIDKSKQAMNEADLVIILLDASRELNDDDRELLELTKNHTRLVVYNKMDEVKIDLPSDALLISAKDNAIEPLIDAIEAMYEKHNFALHEPTLANERHIALLTQAKDYMMKAIDTLEMGLEVDLATIDMQSAYDCIIDILGEKGKKDLLDELFSRFCLGK